MTCFGTARVKPAMMAGMALAIVAGWSVSVDAAKPRHKQALAACRAKYGKKVVDAIISRDGKVTCRWRVRRAMTRAEAYDYCQKKFGPTTVFMQKTKNGWRCRYRQKY
ncbi:MAG: hypothetical protein AB7S92_06690 [Parvibaculaceae bacterium]